MVFKTGAGGPVMPLSAPSETPREPGRRFGREAGGGGPESPQRARVAPARLRPTALTEGGGRLDAKTPQNRRRRSVLLLK